MAAAGGGSSGAAVAAAASAVAGMPAASLESIPCPVIEYGAPAGPFGAAALPGTVNVCGPALKTRVVAVCGSARALDLELPHGPVRTPVFMPVGTQGTVKGVTPLELQAPPLDCDIILGNTYHLGNRPGGDRLEALGGLHTFMGWPRNLLTDSGGFQMVSLLHLAEITEAGVLFQSPVDGSEMLLTPEMSMRLQNQIGSDIMMALDDVVDSKRVDAARFTEATHRTLRWIDRCIAAHGRKGAQNLFGILQGGLDVSAGGLRDVCMEGMLRRDAHLPGYAIGGLAGGESKDAFWRVVAHACARLPAHKPRYLMGVGYPLDLVVCSALGVDMYDCVYPTRTARFGTAMADVPGGLLKLKAAAMAADEGPLDPDCACFVCKRYSRAALHTLLKAEALGPQLLSYHNIAYMMRLTRSMRAAIAAGAYPDFVRRFLSRFFPRAEELPGWVVEACDVAGFDVRPHTWPAKEGAAPAAAAAAAAAEAAPTAVAAASEQKRARLAEDCAASGEGMGGAPAAASEAPR